MSEIRNTSPYCGTRDSVYIDTNRILDSCRDKDCFENVTVYLSDIGNELLERATAVRTKCAKILCADIHVDHVPFNRGFYQITITMYIKITVEICACLGRAQEVDGITVIEKKVILYGSESNVSIFKSNPDVSDYCTVPEPCCSSKNVPIAIVEVVDPIVLNTKVKEAHEECCCCCCCNDVPDYVASRLSGTLRNSDENGRYITVSLGIFSVVRIVRPAQYLVNATEYCVPDKECVTTEEDNPCRIFKTMEFPTAEFCPPGYSYNHVDKGSRCGCQDK